MLVVPETIHRLQPSDRGLDLAGTRTRLGFEVWTSQELERGSVLKCELTNSERKQREEPESKKKSEMVTASLSGADISPR